MAKSIKDLLAGLNNTRKRILDSTTLDDRAISLARGGAGTVREVFRPVQTFGHNFRSIPSQKISVSPGIANAVRSVNRASNALGNINTWVPATRQNIQSFQSQGNRVLTSKIPSSTVNTFQQYNPFSQRSLSQGVNQLRNMSAAANAGAGANQVPESWRRKTAIPNNVVTRPLVGFLNTANRIGSSLPDPLLVGANTIEAGRHGLETFSKANRASMRAGTDPIKQISAVAQGAYGLSAIPTAFTPTFQAANAAASLPQGTLPNDSIVRRGSRGFMQGMTDATNLAPNVQRKETNIPVIGGVDLAEAAGSMAGFTRNPLNKGIFGQTENITLNLFRQGTKLSRLGNFLATNALRGGTEDFLMSLDDIPENASEKEKAQFMLGQVGEGVLYEIGMRGAGETAEGIGKAGMRQLSGLFDSFKGEVKTNPQAKEYIQNMKKLVRTRKDGTQYEQAIGKGGFQKKTELKDGIAGFATDPQQPWRQIAVRESDIRAGRFNRSQLLQDNSQVAAGAVAGFEPEYDENGNLVGVKYNQTKGAVGLAVMGGLKSKAGREAIEKLKPQPTKGVEAEVLKFMSEAEKKAAHKQFSQTSKDTYEGFLNQFKNDIFDAKTGKPIEIGGTNTPTSPLRNLPTKGVGGANTTQVPRILGLPSENQGVQAGRIPLQTPQGTRPTSLTPAQPSASQQLPSAQGTQQPNQRLQFQSQSQTPSLGKTSGVQSKTSEEIIQQAKSQIGRVGDEGRKPIREVLDDLYTQWVNRFAPIERAADKTKIYLKSKNAQLRPENDPSFLLRRLTGAGGIADARYQNEVKPLIARMESLGIEKSDLDVYLANRRIAGFGDIGREVYGADPAQAKRVVTALNSKYGSELDEIAQEFYRYQDQGLDELVQSGFLSREAVEAMRENNPDYAPLQRVMNEVEEFLGLPTRKTMQGTQPVKKLKGSDRQILSPLESIIANTFSQRAAIEKNNVARSLVDLQQITDLGFRKVKNAGNDTITVWRDGQKEYWQVGTDIAETAKGLNEENMNAVLKILQAPASLLRQGATGRNPDFMIPNIVRDQIDAGIASKYGYIPFVDYTRGLIELAKKDINTRFGTNFDTTIYDKWANSGARIDLGELSGRKSIQQSFDEKTAKKGLFSWLGAGLDFLGRYSEQPTRIGLFNKAYKKTGNELLAAMESRDSTVDFARMGSKMKVANSIIPFLNVQIQGFDKVIRAVKDDPKKVALNMAIYGTLPAVTTTAYNLVNFPEEYSEIPQYEKDSNFILISGRNDDGTVNYFTIPKGNIVPLVANPIENLMSFMAGQDQQTFTEFATQFISSALPVVGDGSSIKEVALKTVGGNLPQMIKPVSENLLNKSFWKYDANKEEAKEIVPYYLKDKEPYQQAYEWTPATYKAIGAALNVSPLQVQNLMEGYLAGYIKVPNQIIQSLQNISEGKPVSRNDMTILRRFSKTTYPNSGTKVKEEKESTPLMQRLTGQASASDGSESIALPDNTEDLGTLYKDAERIISNYQENKVKSQYGLVDKDLEEYQEEVDAAIAMKKRIEKEQPEKVFEIQLDSNSSGSSKTVEQRADWVVKTLENIPEDKLQDTINKMWEAKVLTKGASGVAQYIEDEYGVELKYTGSDSKLKKKAKKITVKASRVKLNTASAVRAPATPSFGGNLINTSNLLKLNTRSGGGATRTPKLKMKVLSQPKLRLKQFDTPSK